MKKSYDCNFSQSDQARRACPEGTRANIFFNKGPYRKVGCRGCTKTASESAALYFIVSGLTELSL